MTILKTIEFKSVIEVGCGFGRITKLMLENFPSITEYDALDILQDQIDNARKYLGALINKVNNFYVTDIMSMDSKGKKYDLVLICEVLLHIPHSDIQQILDRCISWSRKHVINIDWYEDKPTQPEMENNCLHQYAGLYHNNPATKKVNRLPLRKKLVVNCGDETVFISCYY